MSELSNLRLKRGQAKAKVTRLRNYFNNIDPDQINETIISQLQVRLTKIDSLWDEFNDIQSQIELLQLSNNETIDESCERETFETAYFSIISEIRVTIDHFVREPQFNINTSNNSIDNISIHNENGNNVQYNMQSIKLPTIKLPNFQGLYDQWLEFRDAYSALIHNNQSLSTIQKFYYLKSSLEDRASDVIKSLEVTAANYPIAWQLLQDRYENKRLIIHNHVKAIFSISTIDNESHIELRRLFETITKNLRALRSLGQAVDEWDTLLVYIIVSKLDPVTRRDWEGYKTEGELPTMEDINKFLKNKCALLENLEYSKNEINSIANNKNKRSTTSLVTTDETLKCYLCNQSHLIYRCESFLKLPISSRLQEIKKLKLCNNCLKPGHIARDCTRSHCRRCDKQHNTLLHIDQAENVGTATQVVTAHSTINNLNQTQILLSTATIRVNDKHGNSHRVRALLDSGSQSSFITAKLCDQLGLQKIKYDCAIKGVGEVLGNVNHRAQVKIASIHDEFNKFINCLVLTKIIDNIPNSTFDARNLKIEEGLKLADPTFHTTGPIDILIGGSTFWELLCQDQKPLGKGKPILQKTKLGWLVAGNLQCNTVRESISCFTTQVNNSLNDQLTKFWKIEECLEPENRSISDKICESHFVENVRRDKTGRFTVSMPLNENVNKLGESKQMAQNRFYSLERRLKSNPILKMEYVTFMTEYERLGHMSKVNENNSGNNISYYLPHHAVVKESSITTKVRVVFDASAKTDSGVSLNDVQYSGPTIQNELFSIILRFRRHKYAITADISKMYRQILIAPEQRCLQKILWRANSQDDLQCYELNTVTYGTASAPFLATRCLYQLALDNKTKNPLISTIIKNDFYVDDLLTGSDSVDGLVQIQRDITDILQGGGFVLRKWLTNKQELYDQFKVNNDLEANILYIGEQSNKTLGVQWNAGLDSIQYSINHQKPPNVTKRTILSSIAQLFDPLGLLGPIIVVAKLIIQSLWQSNLNWDDNISPDIYNKWVTFENNLHLLNELSIPRHIFPSISVRIEMHGFSDASEKAYGACIFIRYQNPSGSYVSNILCARSRVAPLKQLSLPRLELCGALLLSDLVHKVRDSIDIKFDEYYFWSDSTIVLNWIRGTPKRWKTFVANRVSQIQSITNVENWHHVSSGDNPADLVSRGISVEQLLNSQLWWKGPQWFSKHNSEWDVGQSIELDSNNNLPEQRTISLSAIALTNDNFDIFVRYSSLTKLKRVVAYCCRFVSNCQVARPNKQTGPLTVSELHSSLRLLVRLSQQQSFPQDYDSLSKHKCVNNKSTLLSLNPFIDDLQLLRVGGRIQQSLYDYEKRHPLILHPKHTLTKMILTDEHIRLMHCGPQQLLASIRERYWPISGRNVSRSIVRRCTKCFKVNPTSVTYQMGNLPPSRINQHTPFYNTGVDYAGPILIKDRRLRGAKLINAYICLFICMATKAVHLELVTDLTTEAFLATLKRFTARRGKPCHLFSDNGTNFVGANSKLKELARLVKSPNVTDELSKDNISWHFIPPRAPNFGGLWEAGVKSTKYHLKRVIGESHLSYEDLSTVLTQIEAILNSRPLSPLSADSNDFDPLTPSHFLIGRTLTAIPEPSLIDIPTTRLSRFKYLQQLVQHFWARWSKEYISELQSRSKWKQQSSALLTIGTLVIIKEDNQPPLRWRLGRIVELHPGSDGIIRVVSVNTTSGTIKRAVSKICVLPLTDN